MFWLGFLLGLPTGLALSFLAIFRALSGTR
jgi:hypothetical protein